VDINGIKVVGIEVDPQTRCKHYATPVDIIAIKFPCCMTYYPCFQCHAETADHQASVWRKDQFDEKAILCGACRTELTIQQYLTCNAKCPNCGAGFNSRCHNHYHLYFET
jgi:uncharacterized CHY-type Zn-finger protein